MQAVSNNSTKKQSKTRKKVTYISKALPPVGNVRLPTIIAVLAISRGSFLNGIKEGKFPPGKLITRRCRVWPVEQIRALLETAEAESEV
ncbi:MAG: hypothetical protein ABL903_19270 [Methylococcales bacterium]